MKNMRDYDLNFFARILGVPSFQPYQVVMFTMLKAGGRISMMSRRGWRYRAKLTSGYMTMEKKLKSAAGSSENI